ncbi:MAG TPA: hypothetical protein VKD72_37255, partial [Gemmataceae bacterium]|nr:hypothetical protein [Gemmataceae bacterium]
VAASGTQIQKGKATTEVPKEKPGLVKLDEGSLPKLTKADTDRVSDWSKEQLSEDQREGVARILKLWAPLLDWFKGGKKGAAPKVLNTFLLMDGAGVGKTRQEFAVAINVQKITGKPSAIITQNDAIISQMQTELQDIGVPIAEWPQFFTYLDLATGKVADWMKKKKVPSFGALVYDEAHSLKNITSEARAKSKGIQSDFELRASATPFDTLVGSAETLAELDGREGMTVFKMANLLGFDVIEKTTAGKKKQDKRLGRNTPNWDVVKNQIAAARDLLVKRGQVLMRFYPFWGPLPRVVEAEPENPNFLRNERLLHKLYDSNRGARGTMMRAHAELAKVEDAKAAIVQAMEDNRQVIIVGEFANPIRYGPETAAHREAFPESTPPALQQIYDWLGELKIPASRLYGKGTDAPTQIKAFQDMRTRVMLMTPQQGGTGVNLDDQLGPDATGRARLMVMMTLSYAGDSFTQTLGRVSRRQTKSPSEVLILNVPGSRADAHALKILRHKLANMSAVLRGADPRQSNLDEELALENEAQEDYEDTLDDSGEWGDIKSQDMAISGRNVGTVTRDGFSGETEYVHNPSQNQLSAMLRQSKYSTLRVLDIPETGQSFVWDADDHMLHAEMHEHLVEEGIVRGDVAWEAGFMQELGGMRDWGTDVVKAGRFELSENLRGGALATRLGPPRQTEVQRSNIEQELTGRRKKLREPVIEYGEEEEDWRDLNEQEQWTADAGPLDELQADRGAQDYAREVVDRLHARAGEQLRAKEVLEMLAAEMQPGWFQDLAQRLAAVIPNVPIVSLDTLNDASGYGKPALGRHINIGRGGKEYSLGIGISRGADAETILHEAIHAATELLIQLRGKDHPLIKQLDLLRRGIVGTIDTSRGVPYQLSNISELLAYGFTSPQFQEFLSKRPLDPAMAKALGMGPGILRNMWDGFVATVARLVGIKITSRRQVNALDAVLRYGSEIMERQERYVQQSQHPWVELVDAGEGAQFRLEGLPLVPRQMKGIGERSVGITNMAWFGKTRRQQANALNATGIAAPNTAGAQAGYLEAAGASPNGIAANLTKAGAAQRAGRQWVRSEITLPLTEFDVIRDNYGHLFPHGETNRLREHQNLAAARQKYISERQDKVKASTLNGKDVTGLELGRYWSEQKANNTPAAREFDRVYTLSVEYQIDLSKPLPVGRRAEKATATSPAVTAIPDPTEGQRRMYAKFEPIYRQMSPEWKALYASVKEFYERDMTEHRGMLLEMIKEDLVAGAVKNAPQTANVLNNLDFQDLKAVLAADDKHLDKDAKKRITDVHKEFSVLRPYAPARRRGDYVVRADAYINGVFDAAEADRILQHFPERRLVAETLPDGRVSLKMEDGKPAQIFSTHETRPQAEEQLKYLRALQARASEGFKLEVADLDRRELTPDMPENWDPTMSAAARAAMEARIERYAERMTSKALKKLSPEEQVAARAATQARMMAIMRQVIATMLPDTYIAPRHLERRFVAGASSQDQLRNFHEHLLASSNNLGHLKYDREIESNVRLMKSELNKRRYELEGDKEVARLVHREVERRELAAMEKARPNE